MKALRSVLVCALVALAAFAARAQDGASDVPCFEVDPISQPVASVAACTDAILDPTLPPKVRAEAHVVRGMARRELGSFAASEADLLKALGFLGEDAQTLRMLGWTYREWDRPDRAEIIYGRALAVDDHWQGWLSRCVVRSDLEKWDLAVEDCRAALERDAENEDVVFFLARALSFAGRPAEALAVADQGLILHDDVARIHAERLWALWLMGRQSLALAEYQALIRRFPDDPSLLDFFAGTK